MNCKKLIHKTEHEVLKKLVVRYGFLCLLLLLLQTSAQAKRAPLQPVNLTCEYLSNPVGLDVKKPRFSWTLSSVERNAMQQGYQVVVSADSMDLKHGKGTAWESKKVVSSQ